MKLSLGLLAVCLASAPAWAADRDPTAPPAAAGLALPGGAPAEGSAPLSHSVIVQNGQPYLVVGTRLVAVGQKVGAAKLERITETEIWFREGRQLTKQARFAGIQRSPAAVACAAKPAGSAARAARKKASTTPSDNKQAATAAAPCEGVQP
jgi:hypothetical protein